MHNVFYMQNTVQYKNKDHSQFCHTYIQHNIKEIAHQKKRSDYTIKHFKQQRYSLGHSPMKNFKLTNAVILTTVISVKLKFLMLYFIINTWLQEPYMPPFIFVNELFQNDTKIYLLPVVAIYSIFCAFASM